MHAPGTIARLQARTVLYDYIYMHLAYDYVYVDIYILLHNHDPGDRVQRVQLVHRGLQLPAAGE